MTFDEWLQYGYDQKWATPPVCHIHDGVPLDPEEEQEMEEGLDPCIHVVRVCQTEQHQRIINNTPAMQWRDIYRTEQ